MMRKIEYCQVSFEFDGGEEVVVIRSGEGKIINREEGVLQAFNWCGFGGWEMCGQTLGETKVALGNIGHSTIFYFKRELE